MVILDTSIIIDHLRLKAKSKSKLLALAEKNLKKELAISLISIQELYEGQSTKKQEEEKMLLATISPLRVLSYTYEVAKLAGEIARDLKRPIELADAAIAATAVINGGQLATLNKKDFREIKGLIMV